jgi:hypothetical protein
MIDDSLIDDVAREMTSVPPGADLAARVTARIEAEGLSRRAWRHPWLLSPVAAVALIVMAVVVARRASNHTAPLPERPSLVVAPEGAEAPRGAEPRLEQRRETQFRVRGLEPPSIAPISVERIDVAPLARADAIEIAPIGIERIAIDAMP